MAIAPETIRVVQMGVALNWACMLVMVMDFLGFRFMGVLLLGPARGGAMGGRWGGRGITVHNNTDK